MMAGFGFLFFFGLVAFWIATVVGWILAIVEVARIPDHQYRAAGTEKIVWVLVVVLAGIIGALIWLLAKRRDVLAAAGHLPPPPPGWYPEPGSGQPRWWDGMRWTDAWYGAQPGAGPPHP